MQLPDPIGYAVDVSHWQDLTPVLPDCTHAYVRATYGITTDARAAAHVKHFREQGIKVGLYAFFRASKSVDEQLVALARMHQSCGIGAGDLAPALDVEDDGSSHVTPAWDALSRRFIDGMFARFGAAVLYETEGDWERLGRPRWVIDGEDLAPYGGMHANVALWCAHYTSKPTPITPGDRVPTLWQHRVGIWDTHAPGGVYKTARPLDQSRVYLPVPTIR